MWGWPKFHAEDREDVERRRTPNERIVDTLGDSGIWNEDKQERKNERMLTNDIIGERSTIGMGPTTRHDQKIA